MQIRFWPVVFSQGRAEASPRATVTSLTRLREAYYGRLEEPILGSIELEKRFLKIGERLKKLEEVEAKKLQKQKMEAAAWEYDEDLKNKAAGL